MRLLQGIVCASITPMRSNGEVDFDSAAKLYRYLSSSGIQGLYPNGTNGESLSLTEQERQGLAELAVTNARENLAVYIQCGSSNIHETIRHVRHAQQCGADGAGIMTPAFFKCDQIALETYYRTVLSQTQGIPVYLYNIPSCTGNDILPETFAQIASAHSQVQGIKFSAPDLLRIRQYLAATRNVLIGCDAMILDCMMAGGAGTVSGPCAIFPKRFARLYRQILAGDMEAAAQTQTAIYKTAASFGTIPEIPAIKTVLSWLGIIESNCCRAPLRTLSNEELRQLEKIYDAYTAEE